MKQYGLFILIKIQRKRQPGSKASTFSWAQNTKEGKEKIEMGPSLIGKSAQRAIVKSQIISTS